MGAITADTVSTGNSGGAGGSVYLTTATLSGTGSITADGRTNGAHGHGGGGRVARRAAFGSRVQGVCRPAQVPDPCHFIAHADLRYAGAVLEGAVTEPVITYRDLERCRVGCGRGGGAEVQPEQRARQGEGRDGNAHC